MTIFSNESFDLCRYYKNHFKDSVRQCCLDIVHGVNLNEIEIQDFWADLRTLGCIASEILPDEPPSYTPQIALKQEFELANVLYQFSRSVFQRFLSVGRSFERGLCMCCPRLTRRRMIEHRMNSLSYIFCLYFVFGVCDFYPLESREGKKQCSI